MKVAKLRPYVRKSLLHSQVLSERVDHDIGASSYRDRNLDHVAAARASREDTSACNLTRFAR